MKKKTSKTKPGKESAPEKGHRPASPELLAKLTARTRAKNLKERAQYGNPRNLDKQVTDFITAYYAGNYPLTDRRNGIHPEFDEDGEQTGESEHCALQNYGACKPFDELARQLLFPPALVRIVFDAILSGDAKKLRNFAAAVERVQARAEFIAGKLTFKPAKPELAKLAERAIAGGKSGEEIADGIPYTARHARRIAKKVGVPPKATKWQN
jgi:hypothetical protein